MLNVVFQVDDEIVEEVLITDLGTLNDNEYDDGLGLHYYEVTKKGWDKFTFLHHPHANPIILFSFALEMSKYLNQPMDELMEINDPMDGES